MGKIQDVKINDNKLEIWVQTVIGDSELLTIVKKPVSSNGTFSIGKEFAGRKIIAYVIEDKNDST